MPRAPVDGGKGPHASRLTVAARASGACRRRAAGPGPGRGACVAPAGQSRGLAASRAQHHPHRWRWAACRRASATARNPTAPGADALPVTRNPVVQERAQLVGLNPRPGSSSSSASIRQPRHIPGRNASLPSKAQRMTRSTHAAAYAARPADTSPCLPRPHDERCPRRPRRPWWPGSSPPRRPRATEVALGPLCSVLE